MVDTPYKQPEAFPVDQENVPVRRRALFSQQMVGLHSHHAHDSAVVPPVGVRRRRSVDSSLRLIDDLTNRPLDPLFADSRLLRENRSLVSIWLTRAVTFLLCVVVGFAGSLFVQRLHADPRKAVRASLSGEVYDLNRKLRSTSQEVADLRMKVDARTRALSGGNIAKQAGNDAISNGIAAVRGPGITLTLADPLASGNDASGRLPREGDGSLIRTVTDADLQTLVRLAWGAGAEAIAVNGNRIGVQTSIRTAGQVILIGVNQVRSPYVIEAIGDREALAQALGSSRQRHLYDSLARAGIYPQMSTSDDLSLDEATQADIAYARRME